MQGRENGLLLSGDDKDFCFRLCNSLTKWKSSW